MSKERQLIIGQLDLKRKAREEKLKKQVEEEREKLKQRAEVDDWDFEKIRKLAEGIKCKEEKDKQEPRQECKRQKTELVKQEAGDREHRRKEEAERLRKQVQEELKQQKEKREEQNALKASRDDPKSKSGLSDGKHKVILTDVKQETNSECTIPDRTVEQVLKMTNQDIWQYAWDINWKSADAVGKASDEKFVYAQAQKAWKAWMAERDHLQRTNSTAVARKQAAQVATPCKESIVDSQKVATSASLAGITKPKVENIDRGALAGAEKTNKQVGANSGSKNWNDIKKESVVEVDPTQVAQELYFQTDPRARSDWNRLSAGGDSKQDSAVPRTGRDLCALVKERCPADQPLPFERLLAACPKGTTVRQLVQALSKDPRDFRQDYQGKEFCVRPANSRCVDWLPVQASTTPADFREDASLPDEMLSIAKNVFEQKLKPQGQSSENPLVVFLTLPGRLPSDTPLPFDDLINRCPPGTKPMDLVRAMSKRRDTFRQSKDGSQFCVKPSVKCRDWAAVNPYMDPTKKPQPKSTSVVSQTRSKKEEVSDEE